MSDKVGRIELGAGRGVVYHVPGQKRDGWREFDNFEYHCEGIDLACDCGEELTLVGDDYDTCKCGKVYRLRYDVEVRG